MLVPVLNATLFMFGFYKQGFVFKFFIIAILYFKLTNDHSTLLNYHMNVPKYIK